METLQGISLLINEGQHPRVAALGQLADAKAQQNALLDPGVGVPAAGDRFGGANGSRGERVAKFKKGLAGFRITGGRGARRVKSLDYRL
jgi:hypothetical protein